MLIFWFDKMDIDDFGWQSLQTIPNEVQIEICGYLAATDAASIWYLAQTSRHFHDLLHFHEDTIVEAALACTSTTEKIILYHLMRRCSPLSPFMWIADCQRIARNIDRGLAQLMKLGVQRDNQHLFYDNPGSDSDAKHADRALRTILIAIEVVNISGGQIWSFDTQRGTNAGCGFLPSFFNHVHGLSALLADCLYGYVDYRRTPSMVLSHRSRAGRTAEPEPKETKEKTAATIRCVLTYYGGNALYHLLTHPNLVLEFNGQKFTRDFSTAMNTKPRSFSHTIEQGVSEILRQVEYGHYARPMTSRQALGMQDARIIDLPLWKQAVPDDAAWAKLMFDQGWLDNMESVKMLLRQHSMPGRLPRVARSLRPSYIPMRVTPPRRWQRPMLIHEGSRLDSFGDFVRSWSSGPLVQYSTELWDPHNTFTGILKQEMTNMLHHILSTTTGDWTLVEWDKLPLPHKALHAERMLKFFRAAEYGDGVLSFSRWNRVAHSCPPAAMMMQPRPRKRRFMNW